MKKHNHKNRIKRYWLFQPENFSNLYKKTANWFSPSAIVARFLEQRTTMLFKMFEGSKNLKLLDVGCGSGIHLAKYAKNCKEVVGVDYSKNMLKIAESTLNYLPLKNWKLVKADAEKLPFSNGEFDVAIAMGLLDYVSSPKKVLIECQRVLKKGGLIIFSIPKNPSIFAFLRTPLGNLIKRFIFNLPPVDNAVSYSDLITLLQETKFKPIKISSVWTAMWMVKAKAS